MPKHRPCGGALRWYQEEEEPMNIRYVALIAEVLVHIFPR
jgi:hypothetical protein